MYYLGDSNQEVPSMLVDGRERLQKYMSIGGLEKEAELFFTISKVNANGYIYIVIDRK